MAEETKNDDPLENIEKTKKGYVLKPNQIIKLANYIEKLKTENEKLKAKLKEAKKQLEKAHKEKSTEDFVKRIGDGLTGAGIASLLILIQQGTN